MKEIKVSPDKSISHRAILLGSLCKKPIRIHNPLKAQDTLSTISCMRGLGIKIEEDKGGLKVYGRTFRKPEKPLYCGNSGTTMRLLSGILAGQPFETILSGDSSLSKRPMKRIREPLSMMGADIVGDYPPIKIKGGNLKAISYKLLVKSAQVKSAILFASIFADGKTEIIETIRSRDHTERMFEFFNCPIKIDGLTISFNGPYEPDGGCEIDVPGDFSSSAFFIAAALLLPDTELKIKDVSINETRTGFLRVIKDMGASFTIENQRIVCNEPIGDIIISPSKLYGVNVREKLIPTMIDEVSILAILALFADGRTIIRGAEELRVKESDRIKAIVTELSKIGAKISELEDGMVIDGGYPLKGGFLDAYSDHRIAMAFSILSLKVDGIEFKGKEWVNISFPNFYELLSVLKG